MEKHRVLQLNGENIQATSYFENVEACIEESLGIFHINSKSRVLLVGSGAFPISSLCGLKIKLQKNWNEISIL